MTNKNVIKNALFSVYCIVGMSIAASAGAANVKITPLGSHDGEFCAADRALILRIRMARGFFMTPAARYAAATILAWVRSMEYC